mmetsp:Transcript_18864/g.42026  ORF Transcript_18864/g.42026 Transcript_18864/m.42026 type:complete len:154 (-) Transcript_18864:60-521(-)
MYKQVVTKGGTKYRQRVVRPSTNNTTQLRLGQNFVCLPRLPHLRKVDRRGKSVKVILKYHAGSEQMCRKWYLKRLDIPAAEGVPAIPGYMQSLSNNVTFADIYIADFANKFCMYAHLTELLMEAMAQQSERDNQEVAGDDDEEEVDELEEPEV